MSPSDISKGRVESPLPAESRASGPVDDPRKRERKQPPVFSIMDDGLMRVCLVLSDQHDDGTDSVESEPVYSSDAIDRGEFGAVYHPVTGDYIANRQPVVHPAYGYHVFVVRESETVGWGGVGRGKEKQLERIGDDKPHPASDFPLRHWECDYKTGMKLKR